MLWPEKHPRTDPINSQFQANKFAALGVRAWGEITMTDSEKWKERRDQLARYRVMEQETTDPLAAGLLRGIVSELEAEMDEEPTAVAASG